MKTSQLLDEKFDNWYFLISSENICLLNICQKFTLLSMIWVCIDLVNLGCIDVCFLSAVIERENFHHICIYWGQATLSTWTVDQLN